MIALPPCNTVKCMFQCIQRMHRGKATGGVYLDCALQLQPMFIHLTFELEKQDQTPLGVGAFADLYPEAACQSSRALGGQAPY